MSPTIRLTFFAVLLFGVQAWGAAPTPFDDAVAVWHMDGPDDVGGKNPLIVHGDVRFGVKLPESEAAASRERGGDGKVFRVSKGTYLSAGQGKNGALDLQGKTMSLAVRLQVPRGDWDFPIIAKHGGHEHLAYNLYAAKEWIGCEIGTTRNKGFITATVAFDDLLPHGKGRTAWHDVVCRVNGAKLEMFVDGRCVNEDFMLGELRQNDQPLLIGGESYGDENIKTGFEGLIDHVAIWNRALSDDEILFLSGGRKNADLRERTDRGIPNESLQYWRPPNNYFVGDCLPFYDEKSGVFHFAYLLDKGHHGAKNGLGAHQWAQATSTDLVHWTHQPMLLPITEQWEGSICTGSVFIHDGVYYAFYATRAVSDVPAPDGKKYQGEFVGCATSTDGIHFTKQQPNPLVVLPRDQGYSGAGRDPVVFRNERDGLFHMYVTSNVKGNGCWAHLTSNDLKKWDLQRPVFSGGGDPECPDWFQWGDKYYLIVNWGNGFYRVSDSPTGPWEKPCGADMLMPGIPRVPKTAAFKDGRRIICGWTDERGFGGHAVFHELLRNADGTLGEKFVPEMIPPTKEPVVSEKILSNENKTFSDLPPNYRLRAVLAFDPESRDSLPEWTLQYHSDARLRIVPAERAIYLGKRKLERVDFSPGFLSLDMIVSGYLVDLCINDSRTITESIQETDGREVSLHGESPEYRVESLEISPLK